MCVQGHMAARTGLDCSGAEAKAGLGGAGWTHSPGKCLLTLVAVSCFSLGFASGTRSLYKTEHQERRQRKPTCSQHPGLPFRREGLSQRFAFSGLQVHLSGTSPSRQPRNPPTPRQRLFRGCLQLQGPLVHPATFLLSHSTASPGSSLGQLCHISRRFLGIVSPDSFKLLAVNCFPERRAPFPLPPGGSRHGEDCPGHSGTQAVALWPCGLGRITPS